jgi:hypothetical protein
MTPMKQPTHTTTEFVRQARETLTFAWDSRHDPAYTHHDMHGAIGNAGADLDKALELLEIGRQEVIERLKRMEQDEADPA